MRIHMLPHDTGWASKFRAEKARFEKALGPCLRATHHIGSTAVPTIHAKPVIDILLEVNSHEDLDARKEAMEKLGYEVLGEYGIPGRRYFRREEAGERTHNIHAFETDHPGLERHLAFRDFLIAHPDEARTYSKLKQTLARKFPEDIESYMDGKDPFIKEVEPRALAWKRATTPQKPPGPEPDPGAGDSQPNP